MSASMWDGEKEPLKYFIASVIGTLSSWYNANRLLDTRSLVVCYYVQFYNPFYLNVRLSGKKKMYVQ